MLNVPVSYRLQEYLQILFDFAPLEHHRRAVLKGKAAPDEQPRKMSWHIKGMLFVVGSAAYFYKVSKVGACNFQVHSGGVDRTSKGGTLKTPWSAVTQVNVLSGAYLVQKASGAMPIPFRCMSASEREEFEVLARPKLVAVPHGGT